MILIKWDDLPEKMKSQEVKRYFDILEKKRVSLIIKRLFDVIVSSMMLVCLSPFMLILALLIKLDSPGPVLFKQIRITTYGNSFNILKFRSMFNDVDKGSGQLTTREDSRVTRVGKIIRSLRLDELPQLINIIRGDMSFVGTRPEVPQYVDKYSKVMFATLLLPAGVTSEASILYKNESMLLSKTDNISKVYVEKVLPEKMYYNLRAIEQFSFFYEVRTMIRTIFAVCGKEYVDSHIEETLK